MDRLPLSPAQNTQPREVRGTDGYHSRNARVIGGKVRAFDGYTQVVAEDNRPIIGLIYAEYQGTAEYIYAKLDGLNTKIYKYSGGTETLLATESTTTPYYFVQFGKFVFGITEGGPLQRHEIGTNSWSTGNLPPKPQYTGARGDLLMLPSEAWMKIGSNPIRAWVKDWLVGNSTVSGTGSHNNVSSAWTVTIDSVATTDYTLVLDCGAKPTSVDGGGRNFWTLEFTLTTTRDATFLDTLYMRPRLPNTYDGPFGSFQEHNDTTIELEDSAGNKAALRRRIVLQGGGLGERWGEAIAFNAYNLEPRTGTFNRAAIKKIRIKWFADLYRPGRKLSIDALMGDVWQNDFHETIDWDNGPKVKDRQYAVAYLSAAGPALSPLSDPDEIDFPTPSGQFGFAIMGSYTKILVKPIADWDNPITPANNDELRLYRKRSDNVFVLVETVVYDSASGNWKKGSVVRSAANGITLEDRYHETDLDALTALPDATAPIDDATAIGLFRASLAVGVDNSKHGPILMLSRANRPVLFEPPDAAPNPLDYYAGRTVYVDDTRSQKITNIIGGRVLFVGTQSRWYALMGDLPATLSQPVVVDNIGPVGPRAAAPFADGVVFAGADGVYLLRILRPLVDDPGSLQSLELSLNNEYTVSLLSLDSQAVVLQHEGHIYVFSGQRGVEINRRQGEWHYFELPVTVRAAVAHPSGGLIFGTEGGGIFKMGGADFAGISKSWEYETGDLVAQTRLRLTKLAAVTGGSPTIRIQSWADNRDVSPTFDKTYVMRNEDFFVPEFQPGLAVGSKFRFTLAGVGDQDTVDSVWVEFEPVGGGGARAS